MSMTATTYNAFALVRKLAHDLLQQEKKLKRGVKTKRFLAALDEAYLIKVLSLNPGDP